MTGDRPQSEAIADATIADEIVTETLLRCWVRETGVRLPADARTLGIDLPASGLSVRATLTHHSPAGWHGFGPPRLVCAAREPAPVDAGLLAALLVREVVTRDGLPPALGAQALGRIIDSAGWIASCLAARGPGPDPATIPPFLAAEQALITGHPFHPAAKSRQGASPEALATYSPEVGGSFALHWFAAHPSVVTVSGSTTTRSGGRDQALGTNGRGLIRLLADLAREDAGAEEPKSDLSAASGSGPDRHGPPGLTGSPRTGGRDRPDIPAGYVVVPAHPWQADEVSRREPVAELLADGRLIDLGVSGHRWYPTSSLRTVWRPEIPVMLKLSLGMRITNSRRVLQLDELRLGAMTARLIDAGLGAALAARHPNFRLIGEPGWVAVTRPGGEGRPRTGPATPLRIGSGERRDGGRDEDGVGLETAVRVNPFGSVDRVVCAAALIAPRPERTTDSRGRARTAMLPRILTTLAGSLSDPLPTLTDAWFDRYLTVVAAPVVDLYLHFGIGVEAHLQNTLVTLDAAGWPIAGWYRDSQGYYVATSATAEVQQLLPGFGTGLNAIFDDALVAERTIYYLFVNNVFALAGALGVAGVADERRLLGRVRGLLHRLDEEGPRGRGLRPPAARRALITRLLDSPTLPCKANLRTCVDGRDELVGPVATQSVYVPIPNPLLEAS